MKKYILFIVMIGFLIFLQSSSLYDLFTVRGISADFILIGVCLAAFFLGPLPGEIFGFVAGFVLDIIAGGLLGISAFTYTIIGFGVGIAGQKVYSTSILVSIVLVFLVTLIKAVILGALAALFLRPGFFGYFSQGRIFLEIVLNCVIYPVFFFIVNKFERNVSAQDALHLYRYRK